MRREVFRDGSPSPPDVPRSLPVCIPRSAPAGSRQAEVPLSLMEYGSGPFQQKRAPSKIRTQTFADVAGQKLQLDQYDPQDAAASRRSAVIVVHGGAWNAGKRSDFPQWDGWLASLGYTVFDIDYRIAPQPNAETATNDVLCAVQWVKRNAQAVKVSPDRIILMGRSAGGHLALLAAYKSQQPVPICGTEISAAAPVRAVVAFYAPTDLAWSYDHPANQRVLDGPETLRRFIGSGLHQENAAQKYRNASPADNITAATPPTFLVHGGKDQLVLPENAAILDRNLSANGVHHETIFLPYAQHGFDYNFHGWGSQIVKARLIRFLDGIQP